MKICVRANFSSFASNTVAPGLQCSFTHPEIAEKVLLPIAAFPSLGNAGPPVSSVF